MHRRVVTPADRIVYGSGFSLFRHEELALALFRQEASVVTQALKYPR